MRGATRLPYFGALAVATDNRAPPGEARGPHAPFDKAASPGDRPGVLRVAILSRRWSVRAGNERVAVELGRQMHRRGHDVRVYCHKDDGSAPPDALGGDPARVVHLPGVGFDPTLALLSYAWVTRRLVAELRAARAVDVVIGFGHSVVHDVYRLGGGTQAEFLALAQDHAEARGGPVLDRVALAVERRRFAPQASPLLVAPSERVAEELERHYQVARARIRVVHNGIDLARFSPTPARPEERREVRARWGLPEDRPVALFVGQDPARKGFDAAARAAHALGVPLVYVGRAPRPRVLPPGIVWDGERSDVEACYRAADVLFAPSRYDPFGGAVLEALAAGCLPVATRRIGATEYTRGTPLDALLVDEPDDVEGLVAGARRALDPAARPALLAEALRTTRDASRERWGDRMEAVLHEGARARESR